MRKIVVWILAAFLLFSVAGCKQQKEIGTQNYPGQQAWAAAAKESAPEICAAD